MKVNHSTKQDSLITGYSTQELHKTTVTSFVPFNTSSNRKDIREQTMDGTITYHPDPSKYAQTENMIASHIVSNIKPNMYEVVTRS